MLLTELWCPIIRIQNEDVNRLHGCCHNTKSNKCFQLRNMLLTLDAWQCWARMSYAFFASVTMWLVCLLQNGELLNKQRWTYNQCTMSTQMVVLILQWRRPQRLRVSRGDTKSLTTAEKTSTSNVRLIPKAIPNQRKLSLNQLFHVLWNEWIGVAVYCFLALSHCILL